MHTYIQYIHLLFLVFLRSTFLEIIVFNVQTHTIHIKLSLITHIFTVKIYFSKRSPPIL